MTAADLEAIKQIVETAVTTALSELKVMPPKPAKPEQILLSEAARLCGCHPSTLRTALASGELPGYRMTPQGRWRVWQADVERYLAGHSNKSQVKAKIQDKQSSQRRRSDYLPGTSAGIMPTNRGRHRNGVKPAVVTTPTKSTGGKP